jgi:hypothetical protein
MMLSAEHQHLEARARDAMVVKEVAAAVRGCDDEGDDEGDSDDESGTEAAEIYP